MDWTDSAKLRVTIALILLILGLFALSLTLSSAAALVRIALGAVGVALVGLGITELVRRPLRVTDGGITAGDEVRWGSVARIDLQHTPAGYDIATIIVQDTSQRSTRVYDPRGLIATLKEGGRDKVVTKTSYVESLSPQEERKQEKGGEQGKEGGEQEKKGAEQKQAETQEKRGEDRGVKQEGKGERGKGSAEGQSAEQGEDQAKQGGGEPPGAHGESGGSGAGEPAHETEPGTFKGRSTDGEPPPSV